MSDKTGGPAFPVHIQEQKSVFETQHTHYWGMSIRDYFAAKAMQGMLASGNNELFLAELAMESYTYADAMLKEREK